MNVTGSKNKLRAEQLRSRRLIFDMIDASMKLALQKGDHLIENGCNCMACINKRKAFLAKHQGPWKYKL